MSTSSSPNVSIICLAFQKVWKAVSTSEGIAAWFMPNDFQPKVGHEFTLQSPFGPSPCKVLELDPPKRLSFAWDESGWRVTFELTELEGKTEFTLIHSGWGKPDEIVAKPSEKNSVIRDRMNKGWEGLVNNNLRKVVEL
ncbi:SRPBCC domain-containing protein [Paenactinomyces guangxiensis]|uniref:SRPBCC domain-containing protein n=1 Tax=Paenactinomyces guangxiensis TaxID=1490290 RepID=A0A7W2A6X7_9BACL|nr:SRPBCC domain-containing protein [Paenactinomyces guangxiensis]MBA4493906.1 SRPBCC domain-containing protein [Paenactinomyces guangxiensis]MBH8591372.1 SRPBCC domain-containing protein [Paenactinomyces guangxiensis]